jgi:cellulose synthase/poly-beta-1,6-N-acetylglucosamine synthase-like glycosyltransferase
VLAGLALVLLGAAVWLMFAGGGSTERRSAADLPVNLPLHGSGVFLFLAAGGVAAASFVGLAAVQTAAAMRVLSPERHQPPPLPDHLRRLRRLVLAPPAVRSLEAERSPEWPHTAIPRPEELPQPGERLRCHVLIPAHDEEVVIGATLTSLSRQRRPPDRVTVIADNCTDGTAEIAQQHGADVVETLGNTAKKAGALNQELARLLPRLTTSDVVMVMDADSTLAPGFLEVALGQLEHDPGLMAVGGLFYGEPGGGLLGQYQRNEFSRYQRVVARRLNRVFVLTGTASVIRAYALDTVARVRGSWIPGTQGQVYDTIALTEDNELTLALRTLGARMTSPPQCRVTTEIMTSWSDLWRQRERWHRGALENIGSYGLTRASAIYWAQQLGLTYGVLALYSYFALLAITLLAAETLRWSPFWVTVGCVFVVERLVTVWAAGWRARLVAAPVIPELGYAAFLQACFVRSFWAIISGTRAEWNYVPRSATRAITVAALSLYLAPWGILLPTAVLDAEWYRTLCIWVGFNTLVFVFLSLLQLVPPRRRSARDAAREARREARIEIA